MKEYIWLLIFLTLCTCTSMINADAEIDTTCSNASKSFNIPVVTFCANSQASGNAIVMDGYYANSISDEVCNCIIRSNKTQQLQLSQLNSVPFAMDPVNCFSSLKVLKVFTNDTKSFIMKCEYTGGMAVDENDEIKITLMKTGQQYDTRYCLLLGNLESAFDVTCSANHLTTTHKIIEESTEMIDFITSTTSGSTEQHATSTESIKTSIHINSTTSNTGSTAISNSTDEDDMTLYIGIGAGGGAVLFIIVIAIVIGCKRRQKAKTTNETQQSQQYVADDDDGDDDELKYNVLYMSSDNVQTTQCNTIDDNRISYDIEGNYTMVDTDENATPNNVDKSFKPEVAPKPENNTLSNCGSNIKPQNSSVKHISIGDGGCEYAVVQKSKHSDGKEKPNIKNTLS